MIIKIQYLQYLKSRNFCNHKLLRSLFLRLWYEKINLFRGITFWDLSVLWKKKMENLFLRCQCFYKSFLTKSKKKIRYIWE